MAREGPRRPRSARLLGPTFPASEESEKCGVAERIFLTDDVSDAVTATFATFEAEEACDAAEEAVFAWRTVRRGSAEPEWRGRNSS